DDHRVPRQLVVDEAIAELEVQALGTGTSGDEHTALLALKPREPLDALRQAKPALEHDGWAAELPDSPVDQFQCRQVLAEDDELVVVLGEDAIERVELAVGVDCFSALGDRACVTPVLR